MRLKSISALVALMLAAALFCLQPQNASAEQGDPAVDYLDYSLYCPVAVYADEQVVAVSCSADYYNKYIFTNGRTEAGDNEIIYFYGGNIYERPIKGTPTKILRSGDRLYYLTDFVLRYVTIGEFEERTAIDLLSGDNITASGFAVCGERMIVITRDNVYFYKIASGEFIKLAEVEYPAYYSELKDSNNLYDLYDGNVYITDNHDYFFTAGSGIYDGSEFYENRSAQFITDVDGRLCFSDGRRIYIESQNGKTEELALKINGESANIRALGVSGGDGLVFVGVFDNGDECKLMTADGDGNVSDYTFDLSIKTDARVAFSPNLVTARAEAGVRIHRGELALGESFEYACSEIAASNEDFVVIGEVAGTKDNSYYVLYGKSGYALIQTQNATLLQRVEQQSSGVILNDCAAYDTCVDDGDFVRLRLKKGESVTVKAIYSMNGVDYSLIQTEGGEAFVPSGEIAETLLPSLSSNTSDKTTVTGVDRTMPAVIIIICSLAVLIFALFVILVEKEYIKL